MDGLTSSNKQFLTFYIFTVQLRDKIMRPYPFMQSGIETTFLLNIELQDSNLLLWVSAMSSHTDASEYFAGLRIGEESLDMVRPQGFEA